MTNSIVTEINHDQILDELEGLQKDAFWDGSGTSDVRSSSDHNPGLYYDPASAYKEKDNRSVASLLPSRGPRGVIIPRASRFGRSLGWNPEQPVIVNIDPNIEGGSSVVDLSKLTKDQVNQAVIETAHITNPRLAAAVAFRKLAVSTTPVGMPGIENRPEVDYGHPAAMGGAYVAPKASLGGGQVPQVTRATPVNSIQPRPVVQPSELYQKGLQPVQTPSIDEEEALRMENQLLAQEAAHRVGTSEIVNRQVNNSARQFKEGQGNYTNQSIALGQFEGASRAALFEKKAYAEKAVSNGSFSPHKNTPNEEVTFEVDGFGHLTTAYHAVVRDNISLVLVYDKDFKGGSKFFPQASDTKKLIVDVRSHSKVYQVMSPGIHFNLDYQGQHLEICVLLIVDEADKNG